MHSRIHDVALAIQCGGESRRMQGDKALLPFLNVTLLEWVRDLVLPVFAHVFVVARDAETFGHFGMPVVTDALSSRGAAVGVYTAITASPVERVLCLACDMPFVTPAVLRALAAGSRRHEVFVPKHGPYMQPLCAVYARSAGPAYRRFIDEGGFRVDEMYTSLDTGFLDMDDGRFGDPDDVFMNVNTPADLENARERALAELLPHPAGGPGNGARPTASRVVDFMERTPVPTVSFVGKKKSGKTTVLAGVIGELARRGHRIAVFKHDVHGFDVDIPGTDSYRLREAGAVVAGISSPRMYVLVHKPDAEPSLEELISRAGVPVDLVITEGFKREAAPKIEVSRSERSATRICAEDELVGVATDQPFVDLSVPQLALDDFAGLADLVEERIIAAWPGAYPAEETL